MNSIYHCGRNPDIICKTASQGDLAFSCEDCPHNVKKKWAEILIKKYFDLPKKTVKIHIDTGIRGPYWFYGNGKTVKYTGRTSIKKETKICY